MTVLTSCAVGAESRLVAGARTLVAVNVECPPTYPFRASIEPDRLVGVLPTASIYSRQMSGRQRLPLLPDGADPAILPWTRPILLTIAY